MSRSEGGSTLIELVAALAASALVLLAAASLLLLGMRIQSRANDMFLEQQTVDIVFDIVAELAVDGEIANTVKSEENLALYDKNGDLLLQYVARDESLAMGGRVLLEGVKSTDVRVAGKLLTLTVETRRSVYEITVYCRVENGYKITAG